MGCCCCCIFNNATKKVSISNSLIHLLQTDQNDAIIKKLAHYNQEKFKERLNFQGDTIMHFACKKNNVLLVKYLIDKGADFTLLNFRNQAPCLMSSNIEILRMLGENDPLANNENQIIDNKDDSISSWTINLGIHSEIALNVSNKKKAGTGHQSFLKGYGSKTECQEKLKDFESRTEGSSNIDHLFLNESSSKRACEKMFGNIKLIN